MQTRMGLGLGLGMTRGAGVADYSPAALFTNGEQGAWYDPSDFSTMFQTNDTSAPVTAVGQTVGRILDKSGNDNHATQATAAARPILRQSGALFYLESDGVDDILRGPTDQTVTQPYTWAAALEHITTGELLTGLFVNDADPGTLAVSSSAGGIYQRSDGALRILYAARRVGDGTGNLATLNSAFTAGTPYVAFAKTTLSPSEITIENGTGSQTASATFDGTVATNAAFRIGHGGPSVQFKFFGGVAVNRVLATEEETELTAYLNALGGVA